MLWTMEEITHGTLDFIEPRLAIFTNAKRSTDDCPRKTTSVLPRPTITYPTPSHNEATKPKFLRRLQTIDRVQGRTHHTKVRRSIYRCLLLSRPQTARKHLPTRFKKHAPSINTVRPTSSTTDAVVPSIRDRGRLLAVERCASDICLTTSQLFSSYGGLNCQRVPQRTFVQLVRLGEDTVRLAHSSRTYRSSI